MSLLRRLRPPLRRLRQALGDGGGEAQNRLGRNPYGHHVEPLPLLLDSGDSEVWRILAVALQDFCGHPGIFNIESNDQMIVDDLVQGPVGRDLSIVGCPDMLDVNFFVGHRFCRCRVLSPLRHRLFTRGGALSPVWAVPTAFGIAGPDNRWSERAQLVGLCGSAALPQSPSGTYRLTESACSKSM